MARADPARGLSPYWLIGPLAVLAVVATAAVLFVWLRPWPAPLAPPPQGVTLWNVTIINPGRRAIAGQTVEVPGGRIGRIYPASATLAEDLPRQPGEGRHDFARRLEATRAGAGGFVTPGLIETRAAYPKRDAGLRTYANLLFLRFGVTSARIDQRSPSLALLRDEILDGRVAGPRLFLGFPPGPHRMPPIDDGRRPMDKALLQPPSILPLLSAGGMPAESPGWATWWRLSQVGREDLVDGWIDATIQAGRELHVADLGVVARQAPADLLVFSADPRRDAAAYESLRGVIANGRFYHRDTLDDAVRAVGHALDLPPRGDLPRLAD